MADAAATGRARAGWWRFLLALLLFVAFGYAPVGIAFLPLANSFLLVAAVAVVCAIVALATGARPALAPVLVSAAGIALTARYAHGAESYRLLSLGWVVIVAAVFGVASLLAPARPFLTRALVTVGVALVIALVAAAGSNGGLRRVQAAVYDNASQRTAQVDRETQNRFATTRWRRTEAQQQWAPEFRRMYEESLHALPARTVLLLPSLLALQTLAGLALGWQLFHKLSRWRIGPPLAPLREFTFSDQLVWAAAVGLTILVLPEFAEGRAVGLNLLIFFGALFALRGLGVIASFRRRRAIIAFLVALTILGPFFGAWLGIQIPGGLMSLALILSLGLADIWLDVRKRASPGA